MSMLIKHLSSCQRRNWILVIKTFIFQLPYVLTLYVYDTKLRKPLYPLLVAAMGGRGGGGDSGGIHPGERFCIGVS